MKRETGGLSSGGNCLIGVEDLLHLKLLFKYNESLLIQ